MLALASRTLGFGAPRCRASFGAPRRSRFAARAPAASRSCSAMPLAFDAFLLLTLQRNQAAVFSGLRRFARRHHDRAAPVLVVRFFGPREQPGAPQVSLAYRRRPRSAKLDGVARFV